MPRFAIYAEPVPVYEYRCRTCGNDFEVRRPMAESSAPATCPDGHTDGLRRMSVVASIGSAAGSAPSAPCGAACACHPG